MHAHTTTTILQWAAGKNRQGEGSLATPIPSVDYTEIGKNRREMENPLVIEASPAVSRPEVSRMDLVGMLPTYRCFNGRKKAN